MTNTIKPLISLVGNISDHQKDQAIRYLMEKIEEQEILINQLKNKINN